MANAAPDYAGLLQSHRSESAVRVANATRCLRLVRELSSFERVVDFGCGIGAWLAAAQQLGAKTILGLEAEWIKNVEPLIPREHIKTIDLSADTIDLKKQFDLAITIEVAEHLPESSADRFCDSLVRSADFILFSAAIPGQGGVGHVNEQPLPYWVRKFWHRGYVPLEVARPYIAADKTVYFWLRSNLVAFVNYDLFLRSDRFQRFARPLSEFAVRWPVQ